MKMSIAHDLRVHPLSPLPLSLITLTIHFSLQSSSTLARKSCKCHDFSSALRAKETQTTTTSWRVHLLITFLIFAENVLEYMSWQRGMLSMKGESKPHSVFCSVKLLLAWASTHFLLLFQEVSLNNLAHSSSSSKSGPLMTLKSWYTSLPTLQILTNKYLLKVF